MTVLASLRISKDQSTFLDVPGAVQSFERVEPYEDGKAGATKLQLSKKRPLSNNLFSIIKSKPFPTLHDFRCSLMLFVDIR